MTRHGPAYVPSIARKILVVVEERRDLKEIVITLQRAGYEAPGETEVVKALQLAQELRPELMVIDWKMPRGIYDGLEFLFKVRQDPNLRGVPVILLVSGSGWYPADEFFAGVSFAPDDYLIKPFGPFDLLAKVRDLMTKHYYPRESA